jgi:hypothetical protein
MGEWRKVETPALEGATDDHTAYEYQFGGEIDGVFVPAVTKSGGYIDALIAAGKATQEQESGSSTTSSQPTTGGTPADQPTQPAETTPGETPPAGGEDQAAS